MNTLSSIQPEPDPRYKASPWVIVRNYVDMGAPDRVPQRVRDAVKALRPPSGAINNGEKWRHGVSELDKYRKLENRRKDVQRELSSAFRRLTKLEEKIERKKTELIEIGYELLALKGEADGADNEG